MLRATSYDSTKTSCSHLEARALANKPRSAKNEKRRTETERASAGQCRERGTRDNLRPAQLLSGFLCLSDLGPARFLSQRNSPPPCCRKYALAAARYPCRYGCAHSPGKLFENRNSLPKFLDLVLSIPAFLSEPVDRLSNIRHQYPLG